MPIKKQKKCPIPADLRFVNECFDDQDEEIERQESKKANRWLSTLHTVMVVVIAFALASLTPMELHGEVAETTRNTALDKLLLVPTFVVDLFAEELQPKEEQGSATKLDEEKIQRLEQFMVWFQQNGGFYHNVGLDTFESMGTGVLATSTVREDNRMLFIPKELILCRETILEETKGTEWNRKISKLPQDDEVIAAFLMMQKALGSKSKWSSYLQILPTPSHLLSPLVALQQPHEEKELKTLIQDLATLRNIQSERKRISLAFKRFKRLFKPFFQQLKDGSEAIQLEQSDYLWAFFMVTSRALSIRGNRYLVPFADMFNAAPQPKTRVASNGAHFLNYHRLNDTGMEIMADRDTKAGSQVFEDYGDNSNAVYYVYHGFLMDENPFDCASVPLPAIHQLDDSIELVNEKYQLLENFGMEDESFACIDATGTVHGEGANFFLSVYLMDDFQVAKCKETQTSCFIPLDAKQQQQKDEILRTAAEKQLNEIFDTSLEEDLDIIQDKKLSAVHQSAIKYRMTRKQILQQFLFFAENQLQQLRQEEVQQQQQQQQQQKEAARVERDLFQQILRSSKENEVQTESLEVRIGRFEQWIQANNYPINQLELRYLNESFGFGAFAREPLEQGQVYLSVPPQAIMDVQSANRNLFLQKIFSILYARKTKTRRTSGSNRRDLSMELQLHLMYEKFVQRNESYWYPYLDLLPEPSRMGSPLFYNDEHLELLKGTDLHESVRMYRFQVEQNFQEFQQLVTSQQDNDLADVPAELLSFQNFVYAQAILDSRSIWWQGQRHLVPLLDMVNCMEGQDPKLVHSTALDDSGVNAITKAAWQFQQHEQVVENYGQPNYIYLLYHGFVLVPNSHDCAYLSVPIDSSRLTRYESKREIVQILQEIQVFSWQPELCVSATKYNDLQRLKKLAFVQQHVHNFTKSAMTSYQQTLAALTLAEDRMSKLKTTLAEYESNDSSISCSSDWKMQMILKFIRSQIVQLQAIILKMQKSANSEVNH